MLSLPILFYLVNHIFYLLDVRNQLEDISISIQKQMPLKFGNFIEIDNNNIEWLKKENEILIDVIQKAIQENRFEIVDSGMQEFTEIVKKYITLQ